MPSPPIMSRAPSTMDLLPRMDPVLKRELCQRQPHVEADSCFRAAVDSSLRHSGRPPEGDTVVLVSSDLNNEVRYFGSNRIVARKAASLC